MPPGRFLYPAVLMLIGSDKSFSVIVLSGWTAGLELTA